MDEIDSVAKFLSSIKEHLNTNWNKEQILSVRNKKGELYPNRTDIQKRYQSK